MLNLMLVLGSAFPCPPSSPVLPSFPQGADGQRPNIIVVLMDDVGRDKIGLYGVDAAPPPTPNIDSLAAKGVLFERAWVYQSCSPTRAALLTGRYGNRTGIGTVILSSDGVDTPLPLSEHIIPEDLPGYHSTIVGKWHLGDANGPVDHALQHGFDASVGWRNQNTFFDWIENLNGQLTPRSGYSPAAMGGYAYRATHNRDQPYFLYYCPKLAHAPFHRPPDSLHTYTGQIGFPVQQHKAMVETFDTILGRVLSRIDLSNTYVFVIGDNGSPGMTVGPPFTLDRVKGSVYEGGINVPMIVAGPGIPAGMRCDELVHITDMFATVRELCGFGPPSQGAEDSISFVPLLMDPTVAGARSFLFLHRFPHPGLNGANQRAIRTKRWKLIENVNNGNCQLYDLDADPYELTNLLVTQPGTASDKLKARLLAMMPDLP